MRGLGDQFNLLKQDFVLNSSKYVNMPLDHLEQTPTHFSSSMKLIKDEDVHNTNHPRSASAAGGPSSASSDWKQVDNKKKGKSPDAGASSPSNVLSSTDIKQLHMDGQCLCGCTTHKTDVCGFIMNAGFVVDHNPEKAKAKWECLNPYKRGKGGLKSSSASSSISSLPVSSPPSVAA